MMITPHPAPMDLETRLREAMEAQTTMTPQTHMARVTRPQGVMEAPIQPAVIATAPTRSPPMAHPATMMTQTPIRTVPATRPQADTAAQTQLAMTTMAQETPPPRRAPAMETMIPRTPTAQETPRPRSQATATTMTPTPTPMAPATRSQAMAMTTIPPLVHMDQETRLQAAMADPTPLATTATDHPTLASRSRPMAHPATTTTPTPIPTAQATRPRLAMDKTMTAMALVTRAEAARPIPRLASCWRRSVASLVATSCRRRASRRDRMLEMMIAMAAAIRTRMEVETTTIMTIR